MNNHNQNSQFYGLPNSVQYHNAHMGSHHIRGRRQNLVALPAVHLSPLVTSEPLPPVPFLRGSAQLHPHLQWGDWRELPSRRSYQPRRSTQNALRSPATFPERRELMMLVNINGTQYEVRVGPQTHGATAVSVSDVMEAVVREARGVAGERPAGGSYPYNGRAIHRGPGGVWEWCGLDESPDEDDVWVLYL